MKYEIAQKAAEIIEGYPLSTSMKPISNAVSNLINGGRMMEIKRDLYLQAMKHEAEYQESLVAHLDKLAEIKAENYKETLKYLLEAQKNGELSDAERLEVLQTLSIVNGSLQ